MITTRSIFRSLLTAIAVLCIVVGINNCAAPTSQTPQTPTRISHNVFQKWPESHNQQ